MMLTIPVMNMFTTPVALAAQVTINNVFSTTFTTMLMPIVTDIVTVIFKVALICGIYCIMRSDSKNGLARIKMATIGYAMLSFIDPFTRLIDYAVSQVKLPF